ncbi:MAG: hypothetical protein JWN75_157 [Candidatus Saccharibacteria bacterium]|nr:hypothetical protein [Candidatus Saccharibacteria bacterium]
MTERVSLSPKETAPTPLRQPSLNELPPIESVPILKEYGRLGLNAFTKEYGVKTPLDDRGFVDYGALLSYIDSLVDKEYIWTGKPDIHHLQWEADKYNESHFLHKEDPTIPQRFREIPFHKLLIPRQMHNLIHVVTIPPEVPEYEEMKKRVEAYRIARSLFQMAKQTLDIEAQEMRLIPVPHPKKMKEEFDPVKRKIVERDVLIDRYIEFTEQFHAELSTISQKDVEDLINMDILQNADPIGALIISLDRAVRLNKHQQAIRPVVRGTSRPRQKLASV